MSIKINSLNPFDKGFFGKTMTEWSKFNKNVAEGKASNLKMSSADELNKHFQDKVFSLKLGKLNSDAFVKNNDDLDSLSQFSRTFF